MNENKVPDNSKETPAVPGVDVKIFLPKDPDKDHGKLLAFASANLGGVFTVKDIRIYNSEKRPFVTMPSTKGKDSKYYDICHPTTKEMREALHGAILGEFQKAVERPSVRDALKNAAKEAAAHDSPTQARAADKGAL